MSSHRKQYFWSAEVNDTQQPQSYLPNRAITAIFTIVQTSLSQSHLLHRNKNQRNIFWLTVSQKLLALNRYNLINLIHHWMYKIASALSTGDIWDRPVREHSHWLNVATLSWHTITEEKNVPLVREEIFVPGTMIGWGGDPSVRKVAEKERNCRRKLAEERGKLSHTIHRTPASNKNEVMALPEFGQGVNSRYYGDTWQLCHVNPLSQVCPTDDTLP